jgi:MFS family permease
VVRRLGELEAGSRLVSPRRAPTLAGFAALGLFWGAWAALLPSIQRALDASKGALGVALFFVAVGSLPAMLFLAGPLFGRFGSRAIAWSCAAFAAATVLPGLATTLPALAAALVLAGATSGVLDVGINAQAAQIERASRRRLMPLAHGLYSTGVLVGAVTAGLARSAGAGREAIFAALALVIAATALLLTRNRSVVLQENRRSRGRRRVPLGRALLAIALVGAVAFVVEGAVETWSALFLARQLDASAAVSALGPGVFGASMAIGRFAGQAATRVGDRTLLAGGALGAAVGCVIVAVSGGSAAALVGFALAGAGISLNAPVVFGAAGRRKVDPAGAVAVVTTLAYLGLALGPPLMGGLAEAGSLRGAFAVLAVLTAAVALAATRLRLRQP